MVGVECRGIKLSGEIAFGRICYFVCQDVCFVEIHLCLDWQDAFWCTRFELFLLVSRRDIIKGAFHEQYICTHFFAKT